VFSLGVTFSLVSLNAVCALAQNDSPGARGTTANGFPENGVFEGSAFDSVQMNNGNLHLQIRFVCIPGRGHTFCYVYSYDNRGWYYRPTTLPNGGVIVHPFPELFNAMQWRLPLDAANFLVRRNVVSYTQCGSGTISADGTCSKNPDDPPGPIVCGSYGGMPVYGTVYTNYVLFEPDGTRHGFWENTLGPYGPNCQTPHDSSRLYATDGSGWVIDQSDGIVSRAISKDGTQIIFQDDGAANMLSPTSVKDRNGNDVLGADGRSFPSYAVTDPNTGASTFTYYDSGGSVRNISLTFVSVPVQTQLCPYSPEFGCTNEYHATWQQPSQIQLPDGLKYQFSYEQNQYGEPNSVTLPTGATISWTWGSLDQGGRKVTSRTVTSNGQSATWNYFWGTIVAGGTWQNSMVDPNNNETVYTCQDIQSGFPGEHGDPACTTVKVQYYQGRASSGHLLKTVTTDYCASSINTGNCSTPLPIRETTTLNDTNQISKVETDWDATAWSVPANIYITQRNPMERREYDYGNGASGNMLRRTHYNYLHLNNQSYKNLNLADLPSSVVTYDGTANVAAQTQNTYDGSQLTATSGASGHDYSNFGTSNLIRGNLTQMSQWLNTNSTWLNTTHTYDDLGNLRSTTDPRGITTSLSYTDSWANSGCLPAGVNVQAYATQITNALGQNTRTKYHPCTGLTAAKQNQNDIAASRPGTTLTYDQMNRPVSASSPDGGSVTYDYSDNHTTALPLWASSSTLIDANINLSTTRISVLDGLGRIQQKKSVVPAAQCGSGYTYQDFTFDALGRSSTTSNPYCTTTDPTYGVTSYQYDALGRTIKVIEQDGSVVSTDYSEFPVVTSIDEAHKPHKTRVDALGRLLEVQEANAATTFATSNKTHSSGGCREIFPFREIMTETARQISRFGGLATGLGMSSGAVMTHRSRCNGDCPEIYPYRETMTEMARQIMQCGAPAKAPGTSFAAATGRRPLCSGD